MADLLPVAFHGDTLYLVEFEGEPFTPARPICEAIGVAWQGQHEKLTSAAHRWGCQAIVIPTLGGEQQTLCIPVRKLSGWLANISAAKVKPEIREKLIAYQDECDDALWRYWTEGHASRPSTPVQGNLALLPPLARPRGANLAKIGPYGWDGERVAAARLQLETASGILAGVEFARDDAMVLDLLTAALGICLLADLDCASDIGPDEDQETARAALPTAAVSLLRRADALLMELEGHLEPSAPRTEEAAR